MTLPATPRRAGPFDGNDATTVFPFTFKVFDEDEVVVYLTDEDGIETVLTLDSDYSIALNGDQTADPGGDITYPLSGDPLATGEKLTAIGGLPYDQTLDLPDGGNYSPLAMENALDRIEMQIQQLAETLTRTFILPVSSDEEPFELPSPVAYDLIGWDPTGTFLVNYNPGAGATQLVNEYTANQYVAPVTLTSTAGSVAVNALLSNNFEITLTENTTIAAPTGLAGGMHLFFHITQNGTTPYTLAFASIFKFNDGTAPVMPTTLGAKAIVACYCPASEDRLESVFNGTDGFS